jgi:hypothetical protein
MRYEKAWEICFYNLPAWKKEIVVEDPFGRHGDELAHEAAMLAESLISNNNLINKYTTLYTTLTGTL